MLQILRPFPPGGSFVVHLILHPLRGWGPEARGRSPGSPHPLITQMEGTELRWAGSSTCPGGNRNGGGLSAGAAVRPAAADAEGRGASEAPGALPVRRAG